jgi:putative MATE family efflux protein
MRGIVSKYSITEGKIVPVFFYYAIPSVIGMVAASSASIIDGIFVGNYVGAAALAAVNLTIPLTTIFIGIAIMLSVGSSVTCGKFLGENDEKSASDVFTKSLIALFILAFTFSIVGTIFIKPLIALLGADEGISLLVSEYLSIVLLFAPAFVGIIGFSFFVKVDGRPHLALAGVLASSFLNILLDALFVGAFSMGLSGAALATGIAQLVGFLILATHLFSSKAKLHFVRPRGSWKPIASAAYNGFSEFVNEASAGIVIFILNWMLMKSLGAEGVAAFSIVNYILLVGLMIFYGVSDALQPLLSINFGARKAIRITSFFRTAILTNIASGLLVILVLRLFPETLVGAFLGDGERRTLGLTLQFISYLWPVFLFSGVNIAFSAYFTALHRAKQSALIALSRSLVLPLFFILLLNTTMGNASVIMALPLADALTLLLCLGLFRNNTPSMVIQQMASNGNQGKQMQPFGGHGFLR